MGWIIEVYPIMSRCSPVNGDQQVRAPRMTRPRAMSRFTCCCRVPVDRATVERIGEREGWRTGYFGRGAPGQPPAFHVIEFWLESRVMVEVATPETAQK